MSRVGMERRATRGMPTGAATIVPTRISSLFLRDQVRVPKNVHPFGLQMHEIQNID